AEISWLDAALSASDYRRATGKEVQYDFRASHRIPISAPFSVRRVPLLGNLNLNFNPNFTYNEDWYLLTERRSVDPESGGLTTAQNPGFFALRQFSSSISASTIFYGLFPVEAFGFRGIRHTVRPNVGMTFRPDFYGEGWGYTREYTATNGSTVTYPVVSGVNRGRQQSLT
ncbi:MAG: putative LPS assembly protein LptD, partial [Bacteroidota bacterium]|nr:putative LPS assembly protein LptD [Bacteroidota bacterium]